MPAKRYQKNYGGSASFEAKGYGLAVKANAKANYALSQLNTEKKYKDFTFSPTTTNATSITVLNSLSRGLEAENDRVGDSVRWTSLGFKMTMDNHATGDVGLRLLIVRDKSPNGSVATIDQIIDPNGGTNFRGFRNLAYTKRFDILWDKCYTFTSKTNSSVNLRCVEKYIDLQNRRIKKNKNQYVNKGKNINETNYALGNAGNISDISENAFYLIAVGTDPTAGVELGVSFRGRYIDN